VGFDQDFDQGLTHMCVHLIKVPLGLVVEVFGVRTQVDRDLTTASTVDRRLGLTKNLGRHSLPPLNGISSRDSI
jgi:hypothetical protein